MSGRITRIWQRSSSRAAQDAARKVLLVSSSGGHLLELMQLRDQWPREERAWVTFPTSDALSVLEDEQVWFAHHPTNRNIPNLLRNLLLAVRVVASVRPRAVISTGAGVAVPFCYVGRLLGARVVFIESFARISGPSLTARLVYPVATDFFIQWPSMLRHFRHARYEGSLF
jgi:UDP-N-acetylglucosamine:LPS N-acetylglucosamine transferase